MKCPRCKGRGVVYYMDECNPKIVTPITYKVNKTCPMCKGKGESDEMSKV